MRPDRAVHHGAVDLPVAVRMIEHCAAEIDDALRRCRRRCIALPLRGRQRRPQVLRSPHQQLIFVLEVRVERRSPDVRAVEDLLYCDAVVRSFNNERHERLVQRLARALNPPVYDSHLRNRISFLNKCPVSDDCQVHRSAGLPYLITHTAGDDRKLPVPAILVILPAVPSYAVMPRTYVRMSFPLSKPWTRILN